MASDVLNLIDRDRNLFDIMDLRQRFRLYPARIEPGINEPESSEMAPQIIARLGSEGLSKLAAALAVRTILHNDSSFTPKLPR